jgi:succinyl-diaminopimelate desuccinylase
MNLHLDVVTGNPDQFNPQIEGDRLIGRSAADMRGPAAAMILAYIDQASNLDIPLALRITTHEESGGIYGTKYQLSQGITADFVIAGEPTNLDIVTQAGGLL